jgi:hypothetical protein
MLQRGMDKNQESLGWARAPLPRQVPGWEQESILRENPVIGSIRRVASGAQGFHWGGINWGGCAVPAPKKNCSI